MKAHNMVARIHCRTIRLWFKRHNGKRIKMRNSRMYGIPVEPLTYIDKKWHRFDKREIKMTIAQAEAMIDALLAAEHTTRPLSYYPREIQYRMKKQQLKPALKEA